MTTKTSATLFFTCVLALTTLKGGLPGANAQSMPESLWKWPQSQSSHFPSTPPNSSTNADYNGISSCNGGGDPTTSWSCPHMMLLSPDMQYAAETDGYSDWAVYAVAGIGQASDCGKCFQLQVTSDNGPSKKFFIVQAVNTGSDVSSGQFDILVGAGGFGIYDACASDCKDGRVCSGGHCNAPQYSGGFSAWTPDGNCYGGGVHQASGCDALVTETQRTFADETLIYGCKAAINQGYHQNLQVRFTQVQCPRSLYQITGIRTKSDTSLLLPNPSLSLSGNGRTTTTMDCCKPTCAWRQNTGSSSDPNWPQVFVCDKEGIPLTN